MKIKNCEVDDVDIDYYECDDEKELNKINELKT